MDNKSDIVYRNTDSCIASDCEKLHGKRMLEKKLWWGKKKKIDEVVQPYREVT